MIMEKIKKEKECVDTYNKVPLKFQPTLMKKLMKVMTTMEYIKEYENCSDTN